MICAWNDLMEIFPHWLRMELNSINKDEICEIRLRIHTSPELVFNHGSRYLCKRITQEDIDMCINMASNYSPWSAQSVAKGYITVKGGHRIGLCGEGICKNGSLSGFRSISGLCVRVAKDYPGISNRVSLDSSGSILILGAPGFGKTTLLRDLSRRISLERTVAVVDERGELFPDGISRGKRMDIISGIGKNEGIEMVLRCMGPEVIAVDEITAVPDVNAILNAFGCGVSLLVTAHARTLEEFKKRKIYIPLLDNGVFNHIISLKKDKSVVIEELHI